MKYTPGLWKHNTRKTTFALCVDDFGVKYFCKDDALHLINAVNDNYELTIDWEGKLYCGLNLDWHYTASTLYVDALGAALRLPETLRQRLRGLSALHLWPTMASSSERPRGKWDIPEGWPGAEHPVLVPHRRTGEETSLLHI